MKPRQNDDVGLGRFRAFLQLDEGTGALGPIRIGLATKAANSAPIELRSRDKRNSAPPSNLLPPAPGRGQGQQAKNAGHGRGVVGSDAVGEPTQPEESDRPGADADCKNAQYA
jgi:hypothetical protein